MAFNTAAVQAAFDAIHSQAAALGVFDRILNHEPKSAPGNGTSLAIWWDAIDPVPGASGLNAVSGRVAFYGRIYRPYMAKPEDQVDPSLLGATAAFLAALSSAFTLSGLARNIDLMGAHGAPLAAKSAYTEIDTKHFRIADIAIPVIINDLWSEVA